METDRAGKIESLYREALKRTRSERDPFLEEACRGDAELRRAVHARLAASERSIDSSGSSPARGYTRKKESADGFLLGKTLGHYEVHSEISRGGMGVVYRAVDTKLKREVALKILPAELVHDEERKRRFVQEAQAAAALAHSRLAHIYEIDEHDSVIFIAMELVDGDKLSDIIERERPPLSRALEWARQIAEGLAHAHSKGIVHRDLKPHNVMITRAGEVKIIDFGLAKLLEPLGDFPSSTADTAHRAETHEGQLLGTLAYMSPEQARGGTVDHRSDIFSFGILFYEMLTGELPFRAGSAPETLAAIIQNPAPRLDESGSHFPRQVDSIVRRCLAKDPDERYQSMDELVPLLEAARAQVSEARAPSRLPRWAPVAAAVVLALVVAGGLLQLVSLREPLSTPATDVEARQAVAVLGFRNVSGSPETDWLSTAFSEMLTTELASGESLRTISGEDVARVRIELSLSSAESYSKETLSQLRTNLATDFVVLGAYTALGEEGTRQIRLDLRLQDARTGNTIASLAEAGPESELFQLVGRLGERLRDELGVGPLSAEALSASRAALPSKPEAARFYADGLSKLRSYDFVAARDRLQEAAEVEPDQPLIHSALAQAWSELGYAERAREEAERAFELSADLPREERLLVEARYREAAHETEEAIEIYQTLWRFFPDDLDYGLELARVQTDAGRSNQALQTVAALRELPPPQDKDPRIDLVEADAAHSLSDYARARRLAVQAQDKGRAQGARILLAEALSEEGWVLRALGRPQQAAEVYRRAAEVAEEAGYVVGVASSMRGLGVALQDQGKLEEALKVQREAMDLYRRLGNPGGVDNQLNALGTLYYLMGELSEAKDMFENNLSTSRELGDKRGEGIALNNLAAVLYYQGDLAETQAAFEESLRITREIGNRAGEALALNNLGEVHYLQGQLEEARTRYEESLVLYEEIGARGAMGTVLQNLGQLHWQAGRLDEAEARFEEAVSVCRETGDRHYEAYALYGLGKLRMTRGELARSRERHEEALQMRIEMGETGTVAESRVALGILDIEEGRPERAREPLESAVETFQSERLVHNEAVARAALARSLLDAGDVTAAVEASDRARALVNDSENRVAAIQVAITDARVRARTGAADRRLEELADMLREARASGLLVLELEARLAEGEIEIRYGDSERGRELLSSLVGEAEPRDFGLVASKARTLLREHGG